MSFDSDVAVVGGGNAALCAALCAREARASVMLFECAPPEFRGGNSRHTRNLRLVSPTYTEAEYFDDLIRVTGGETQCELARLVIQQSPIAVEWMRSQGARFQRALAGTLHLDRTNAFFLGGGKALMNTYYAAAERCGVRVHYNAEVTALEIHSGCFHCGTVIFEGKPVQFRARALVIASGGFESNLEWLREAWGPAADNFLVRGTPYNKGKLLRILLESGAQAVGDPTQCHAVAIDARAPKFDGGIVTRLDSIPLGIVVNRNGRRFYDEGEDFWPKRYAVWGRLVAQQPGQIAFSITDSKVQELYMPSVFPPVAAGTVGELASALDLLPDQLERTIAEFNRAVIRGRFDHLTLDDCHTCGLVPPKSHWAQPLDSPPFYAYPLRPGITFTYLGVQVNERAAVRINDSFSPNIFAAGEIMAGNILGKGYLGGLGMAIGAVFGRIAGKEAARAAE